MHVVRHRIRVYCDHEDFEKEIAFYEDLQGVTCERIVDGDNGIRNGVVGAVLILAGTAEQLAVTRQVNATFYVDSLDEFIPWLERQGMQILSGPGPATGGRNANVRHRDGLVVEYFEPAA
jgi:predicted enzyme related to lactoylglutathione lyase